ncbi:MAG: DUF2061 domain-containing protein [Candidatus Bathyarchaeia archaeon]
MVKAISYRVLIIVLDFLVIFILTGKVDIAFWFMMMSNLYTSVAYVVHERIWNNIDWGKASKDHPANDA